MRMQNVCLECHNRNFIDTFYTAADEGTEAINALVRQSDEIVAPLSEAELLTAGRRELNREGSMYHLATVFPPAARVRRLPLTRDQLMLLMAAVSEIFTSVDVYLAHSISRTITPNEWIPIIFGAAAGALLLGAGLLAFRNRPLATVIANLVFVGSIIVGLVSGCLA